MFPDNGINLSPTMATYPGKTKFHPFINYWEMNRTSVRQLNSMYEIYQFDTVISSSWRHFCSLENIIELFEVNGLHLHLHKRWATPNKMSSYRVNDICWWLDEATVEEGGNYVAPDHIILDDPWSGSYLEESPNHGLREAYMINPDLGIDSDIYRNMLSDVTSWRDDPKSRRFNRVFPRRDWDGVIPVETR
jgi:hypothetical protein